MIQLVPNTDPDKFDELKELRDAYATLNRLIENLNVIEGAIDVLNFGIAQTHIKTAVWQAKEVPKSIERIGKSKPEAKKEDNQFQVTRRKKSR